ncbi:MAG: hypothetical protein KF778_20205 [Rhodocyclaceae bacterium]|nr:hypothetical protein [Rhodocyclaceae bacterium]
MSIFVRNNFPNTYRRGTSMGHITPAACLRRIGRYAIVAIGLAGLINPASAQTTLTPTQTLSAAREAHRVESGQKFFGDAK